MNNIIGTCPICNVGNIVETEHHFACNYIKSEDEKCDLTIWKNYYGTQLTEEVVKQLITEKKTSPLDLFTKEGKPFKSSIIINDHNKVSLSFDQVYLDDIECPHCSGKIIETAKSFVCEGYFNQSCTIKVNKVVAGVTLTNDHVTTLLKGGTTEFIEGFLNRDQQAFEAKLYIDESTFDVKFDTTITNCPKCKTGQLKEFPKSYSCSNFKSEEKCNFSVWRYQYGGIISRDNLVELCSKKETKAITFKTKEGNHPYKGKLTMDESFLVKMEKIQKK